MSSKKQSISTMGLILPIEALSERFQTKDRVRQKIFSKRSYYDLSISSDDSYEYDVEFEKEYDDNLS